ncbi:MAG TPA: hypothetical protein VKL22_09285 [Actinomycetota bacterium]|nr:hypothetical protein [Actinomycetota bacterium]
MGEWLLLGIVRADPGTDTTVPKTYTCNPQVASDCWATMSYTTTTGALNDTTTWTAEILGNPARLIL